jgi:hypothetical protein
MPYLSCREATVHRGEGVAGVSHDFFYNEIAHLFSLMHALALQHLRSDKDLNNIEATLVEGRGESQFRMSEIGAVPKVETSSRSVLSSQVASGKSVGSSVYHGARLEEQLQLRKLRILGKITEEEMALLLNDSKGREVTTLARLAMVRSWIMRRLIARQKYEPRGDMAKTSPPIVSRLYQVISDGQLGFAQAAKVIDCPFPFPYHNLIRILLWMYAHCALLDQREGYALHWPLRSELSRRLGLLFAVRGWRQPRGSVCSLRSE